MAKHLDPLSEFKISDLVSEDGITFEIGEQFDCDEEDEDFSYSSSVQYSNEEMLDMLNMNEFDDNDEIGNREEESISLYGISFDKLRAKMTNLTEDGKVMKFIKRKGIGEVVPHNAQVTLNYIGHFEDRDEPFDSTFSNGKPRILRLGQDFVIPGLEIGICSMQTHEVAIFLIHPDLAYKTFGCPPRIPPNETVVFIVHLIQFLDSGSADAYTTFSVEEKHSFPHMAEPIKHMFEIAKDSFLKNNVKRAIREYKRAIDCLEVLEIKDDVEEKEQNKLLSKAFTNIAVCYNKLNVPRQACIACHRVPIQTTKSCYNYGKALLSLGEYDQAMIELQKAHKWEPSNEAVRKLIQLTNSKQRQYLEIEKRLWKNCFNSNKKDDTKATEFRKAAYDLCNNLLCNNEITRQPLPEGLRKEEEQIVREEAAKLGLNVVSHIRYSKNVVYLEKNQA